MKSGALEISGLDGGRVRVTPAQLEVLHSRVEGRLLRAGENGWDEATLIWNGMVARQPALVFQAAATQDVALAIGFAREHALLISIKGGGHNIAGTSIADGGLLLDLSRLRDVTVDPHARRAIVGAGCRLRDVDAATQEHGLATVLGFFSDVGVAGLTLGGGLGYLTRRFGWAVDNLDEVEIVTADSTIRRASRNENPDLFWAVRGGGGNFGVVTRFTFRLHPVGPTVYGGLVAWPFERADEVLRAYRTITGMAPRELAVWLVLLEGPPAPFVPQQWHHKRLCAMATCYTGDLRDAHAVFAPIRALGAPVVDLLHAQPYTEMQSYLDATEPKGLHYYWKTDFMTGLSDDFLAEMKALFATCPIPGAEVSILHLGGALNDKAADDGAVGNRDARYVFGVNGMWDPGTPDAEAERFRHWVRAGWERLRPFSTGGSYINFQTADEDETRIRASYGPNHQRLLEIKRRYDPLNLFRVNRNLRAAPA